MVVDEGRARERPESVRRTNAARRPQRPGRDETPAVVAIGDDELTHAGWWRGDDGERPDTH